MLLQDSVETSDYDVDDDSQQVSELNVKQSILDENNTMTVDSSPT